LLAEKIAFVNLGTLDPQMLIHSLPAVKENKKINTKQTIKSAFYRVDTGQ